MRSVTLTLLSCLLSAALACGARSGTQNATPTPTPPATPVVEIPQSRTCALLTGEELEEVQGEPPTSAQGSEHAAGKLSMSQCFYRLPTFDKSINLEVVRGDAAALKDYWRKRFHPEAVEARERARELKEEQERGREEERERERAAGQVREGGHEEEEKDDEEDSRPQRVQGLGEEAYLTANAHTSTLYVLKGDAVLRLSVSGAEERPARSKKATALAAKALKRL
jgi:hypothetical protein